MKQKRQMLLRLGGFFWPKHLEAFDMNSLNVLASFNLHFSAPGKKKCSNHNILSSKLQIPTGFILNL